MLTGKVRTDADLKTIIVKQNLCKGSQISQGQKQEKSDAGIVFYNEDLTHWELIQKGRTVNEIFNFGIL